MSVIHLLVSALVMLALIFPLGCTSTLTCGHRPPGFDLPLGGSWDQNKVREQANSVNEVCEQYKPLAERIDAAKKKFELPRLSAGDGTLTLGSGTVVLSVSERVNYVTIGILDKAIVTSSIARCQAAMLSYECVIFSDPDNDPRIAGAREMLDRVLRLEALTIKAKAIAEAKTKVEFDQAVRDFKNELQESPIPSQRSLGADSKLSGNGPGFGDHPLLLGELETRLDVLQDTLDSLYRRVDADTEGLRQVADALIGFRLQLRNSGLQLKDIIRRLQRLEDAASAKAEADKCVRDAQTELARVQSLRKALQAKLPPSVALDLSDLYGPLVIRTQQEGFAGCKAELGDAMKERLGSLLTAVSSGVPREDYAAIKIVVHGYSDEEIMTPYPIPPGAPNYNKATKQKVDACYLEHRSNIALAEKRATAVASYIVGSDVGKTMTLTTEKITSVGHDKDFVVTGCTDDACHAKNRRFRIIIDAPSFRFAQPQSCVSAP